MAVVVRVLIKLYNVLSLVIFNPTDPIGSPGSLDDIFEKVLESIKV